MSTAILEDHASQFKPVGFALVKPVVFRYYGALQVPQIVLVEFCLSLEVRYCDVASDFQNHGLAGGFAAEGTDLRQISASSDVTDDGGCLVRWTCGPRPHRVDPTVEVKLECSHGES